MADLRMTDGRVRFWIWQGLALVRYFEGRFRRARAAARRALASAMQASFPYARVLALDLLAHILVHTGELHAGMRLLEQAAQLAASLGYADNAITLRTSVVVHELEYLLRDVASAITRAEQTLAEPGVSFFTRRNGLIELAKAQALHGRRDEAAQALAEARRISLPGTDRRGKSRWLAAQALSLLLCEGEAAARPVVAQARRAADGHAPLLAEVAFLEAMLIGPRPDLVEELLDLAKRTGMARAKVAHAFATGSGLPEPATVEDGLCRALLRCRDAAAEQRIHVLVEERLLGLVAWALNKPPGQHLILLADRLICDDRGGVSVVPAPPGPSRRVLVSLGSGYKSREALAECVWGLKRYVASKHSAVINTAMSRLRAALPEPGWVVTADDGYRVAAGVQVIVLGDELPMASTSAPPPPSDEMRIVAMLRAHGTASSADVARVLGISPSTALRALRRMVGDGRVRRLGSGRATRYVLVDGEDHQASR
ncbi:MAG TPA: winged helix-turn-helix domain-containing protein [Polyangiaceae bacterium]|nr:winged helix-turn-helix domain-containing protein [Polyangiaceae bacterium]